MPRDPTAQSTPTPLGLPRWGSPGVKTSTGSIAIDLFAFWPREGRYYFGRVSSMRPDGRVVQDLGAGNMVTIAPLLLVPPAAGEVLARELQRLDDELDAEISRLHAEAAESRAVVLGVKVGR